MPLEQLYFILGHKLVLGDDQKDFKITYNRQQILLIQMFIRFGIEYNVALASNCIPN